MHSESSMFLSSTVLWFSCKITLSHLTTQKQHYKSSVWCWSPLTLLPKSWARAGLAGLWGVAGVSQPGSPGCQHHWQTLPMSIACRWRGDLVVLLYIGARECFSWRSALLSFTGHAIRELLKDMAWSLCCFGAMETDTHLLNILWKCLNTSNTLDHVCALLISELPVLAVCFLAPGRLWVWCPSFQIHVWSMLSAQLASSSGFFPPHWPLHLNVILQIVKVGWCWKVMNSA